jgi:hypothetical protein
MPCATHGPLDGARVRQQTHRVLGRRRGTGRPLAEPAVSAPSHEARGSVTPLVVALLAVALVLGAGYREVRATNFSGWDEWLVVDLTSRGIVNLPYENRPFSLLFNLVGSLLAPDGLGGFWLVHGLYLWIAGAGVFLIARRLAPGRDRLAFLAAALAVTWAPLDEMRLDPVLLANYSGATAATLTAVVLLVESARSGRPLLLGVGALLGFVTVRALESTTALVVAAPALLWLVVPTSPRSRRIRWALAWLAVQLPALLLAIWPLLPGQPASYQVSGLGLDAHPVHVALRLGRQLALQLLPLVSTSVHEALVTSALLAALLFAAGWAALGRRVRPSRDESGALPWRLVVAGLAGAVLGHAVLVLSAANTSPSRMQILSAPGMGLFLAGMAGALASRLPASVRPAVTLVVGCGVVALGTGRTVHMQGEWDRSSFWPAQNASLVAITHTAPGLEPGTLLVLVDEQGAWPASFTFRHAIRYLYGGTVVGTVVGAEAFLYPVHFTPEGVVSAPYDSIRGPWQEPVSVHPWASVVVVQAEASGRVEVLDAWPSGVLPPLPPGAVYAPRDRIVPAPSRPQRRILVEPPPTPPPGD